MSDDSAIIYGRSIINSILKNGYPPAHDSDEIPETELHRILRAAEKREKDKYYADIIKKLAEYEAKLNRMYDPVPLEYGADAEKVATVLEPKKKKKKSTRTTKSKPRGAKRRVK